MTLAAMQPLLDALDGVAYVSDEQGRVVAVGRDGWDESARETGAASASRILGRNLYDLIVGETVREAYRRVHRAVLEGKRRWVSFEYRCDAPDLRRDMRMSVSRFTRGGVNFLLHQSQMVASSPRPWMSLFEAERIVEMARAAAGLPIVHLCSFCQRVAWPEAKRDSWIAPEDYYRSGGPAEVRVSHGVCPSCVSRL